MSVLYPDEAHLKVLRNIAAGRPELDGFVIEQNGLRAYFQCIVNGWVNVGKLTSSGRAVLASAEPVKVKVTVLNVKTNPPKGEA